MGEPAEDGAFALEAILADLAHQGNVQKFDGRLAFKSAIAAFGEPDLSHAAMAELANEPIRAEDLQVGALCVSEGGGSDRIYGCARVGSRSGEICFSIVLLRGLVRFAHLLHRGGEV